MPRPSPVRSARVVICAWLSGAAAFACGTEAPTPQAAPARPLPPPEPAAATPGIKFDVGTVPPAPTEAEPAVASTLRARLTRPGATGRPLRSLPAVQRFYARRDYRPAWTAAGRITAAGVRALRGLAQLRTHGLDPADYAVDAPAPRTSAPDDVVGFELGLSDAWLTAAGDLQAPPGPRSRRRGPMTDDRASQLASALDRALAEADPGRALHALALPAAEDRPAP